MKKLLLKHKEMILYLAFGGLTTAVNILVFQICRVFHVGLFSSNLLAWIISVIVAFITNKLFVFESKEKTISVVIKEVLLFFGARIFSLGLDMAVIGITVNLLRINELISKITSNIIVILLNYVLSKMFIFKK